LVLSYFYNALPLLQIPDVGIYRPFAGDLPSLATMKKESDFLVNKLK